MKEILRINYCPTECDELGNLQMVPQLTFCGDCMHYEGSNLIIYDIDDPPHGICDHESNWRPSRGDLQVWADCNCQHHYPRRKEDAIREDEVGNI